MATADQGTLIHALLLSTDLASSRSLIDALQGMDPTVPRDIYAGTASLPSISVALVVSVSHRSSSPL